MEALPNTQLASAEHQIWLRAFLRALDGCTPDDAKGLAQRAVDIYHERWGDPIVDDREGLDESEWLINLRIWKESEELDQILRLDPGVLAGRADDAVDDGNGAGEGVARASAGGEAEPGALVD